MLMWHKLLIVCQQSCIVTFAYNDWLVQSNFCFTPAMIYSKHGMSSHLLHVQPIFCT